MMHLDDAFTCFSQTGVTFDEIVLEGASGGTDSLIRYLQSRRQILLRDSAQVSLQNDDPAHFVRAIEVIDNALTLLEQLKQTNIQAALDEAAGQSETVPQDVAEALPEPMDEETLPPTHGAVAT